MIYLVYFLIFAATLAVTAAMIILYSKGYRIRFKDKHFQIENIKKSVQFVSKAVFDAGSSMTFLITPNSKATYSSLKKDFPNFNIDKMKEDIRDYIVSYFKSNKNSNEIKEANNFQNNLGDIENVKEINMKTLAILHTIMDKYTKENGIAKIEFNTSLEYNREYGNSTSRIIQENYITEFVHSLANIKNDKKIKCPKCGNDVRMTKKNIKCSNCGQDMTEDIWYLNSIRKI